MTRSWCDCVPGLGVYLRVFFFIFLPQDMCWTLLLDAGNFSCQLFFRSAASYVVVVLVAISPPFFPHFSGSIAPLGRSPVWQAEGDQDGADSVPTSDNDTLLSSQDVDFHLAT